MVSISYYNPEVVTLETYGKAYRQNIELVAEEIKESIKKRSVFFFDINHGDGDAVSIIMYLLLLDEIKRFTDIQYEIYPYNATHHLSFSTTLFPSNEIYKLIDKGRYVTFVTTDNTPWVPFWNQVKAFYDKLPQEKRNRLKLIDIDHHPWVEKDKTKVLNFFEKNNGLDAPETIYINVGWSKESTVWYKKPNIPCSGEVNFDILRKLQEYLFSDTKLEKYINRADIIEKAVIPLLVATETDLRTQNAIERYRDDREVYRAIKKVTNWKVKDDYRGAVIIPARFVTIANGALRISGGLVDRPKYNLRYEHEIRGYPTHQTLYKIAKAVYFAAQKKNEKALILDPKILRTANNDGSYLPSIKNLYEMYWDKAKGKVKSLFLKWRGNSYELKDGFAFKSEESNMLIALIQRERSIIEVYQGSRSSSIKYDVSNFLKIPPYILFFLTEYPPISTSEIVSSSSFVVAAIEGSSYEPNSYMHISLRLPRNKEYDQPLGLIAESAATNIKKDLNLKEEDIQGGGHPRAAGIRIKQSIVDKIAKQERLDSIEAVEWIIKQATI